jgi:transcriptional regulator with XRE-family HTH domain
MKNETRLSAQDELRFNIERLMEESGCTTQSHLARLSGVTQPHISVMLKGKKSASIDTLEKLSAAMGAEVVDLLMPQAWVQARVPSLVREYLELAPEKRALVRGLIQDLAGNASASKAI